MSYDPQGQTIDMATENTGTQGVLYIQDTGNYIVLGIWCKDPSFTKSGLSFSWNSPRDSGTQRNWTLPAGGGLIPVRSFSLPVSGDISWTLHSTGTTELGGPKTIKKTISRSESAPRSPHIAVVRMVSATSMYVYWNIRQTIGGGSDIKNFDLWYSTTPSGYPGTLITNASPPSNYEGSRTITGLTPNTQYYVWVRSRNAKDNSNWSNVRSILTSGGVMVKYMNEWRNAIPYVKVDGVWKQARAYVKRNGAWWLTR